MKNVFTPSAFSDSGLIGMIVRLTALEERYGFEQWERDEFEALKAEALRRMAKAQVSEPVQDGVSKAFYFRGG